MTVPNVPGGPDEGLVAGDSDGYQSDSDADSGSDRGADSGIDSDGYQSSNTDQSGDADQFDEGLRPLIEQWKSMRRGWWNDAGYETYWDLVKEEEAGWHRMGFQSIHSKRKRPPKSSRELPDATPAEIDLDALAADSTRPRQARSRQVNVRLTELGYQALNDAAKAYGLRPSTLARLLIHRGAFAVLERQRSGDD
jgi:hypothetical protein